MALVGKNSEKNNQNLMQLIRRAHGLVENPDLEKHRQSQDHIGELLGNSKEIQYRPVDIDGMDAEWVSVNRAHMKKYVILHCHGGGYSTGSSIYARTLTSKLAAGTSMDVLCFDYRLAPEHKFPIPLEDCYAAAKALYTNQLILHTDPEKITIIGDSAGGNLTAAVCLMARDRGEFTPRRQILIYPAVGNCYTEESPYRSVHENGSDYLLTAVKMEDYLNLYQRTKEDRKNPYFSPLQEKDLKDLPETLILTAEYDPLRDEGEVYGRKLEAAGNRVEVHRIRGAFHGFFALGIKFLHVQESFRFINGFLNDSYLRNNVLSSSETE